MANYCAAVCNYFDMKGVKYSNPKDNVLKITYSADNKESITITVIFDEDGDPYVAFRCWEICSVKDESKKAAAIAICNDLNNQFRWVKFVVDKDNDIVTQCDAHVDMATVGEECHTLVLRMVNIVDEAYPRLMRFLWG